MKLLHASSAGARFAAGVALPLALVLSSCSRPNAGEAAPKRSGSAPVPVIAGQAIEKSMPVQLQVIGNVQAYRHVAVRAQITGQLIGVHFQEGDEVKNGDLLFTIDPRPAQAALDQARANLARDLALRDNARIEFERQRRLYDSQLISRDEFDKTEANVKSLEGILLADQAGITNATLNLDYTRIHSAVDGRTGGVLVHAGNIVKAQDDVLVEINQTHPIYVSFSAAEQHLTEIRRRQSEGPVKVSARFTEQPGATPQGELTFVDNVVDMTTGTIPMKATFANADNSLWPGQFVQVLVTLREEPHAVVVPSQAVQTGQNGDYVYVVGADQTVEPRRVQVDFAVGNETALKSGLKAGETVVTDGQSRLVPGSRVDLKPASVLGDASTPAPPARPKP